MGSLVLVLLALVGCNTLDAPGGDDTAPFASPTDVNGFFPTAPGPPVPVSPSGVFGPPGGVNAGGGAGFPVAAVGGNEGPPVAGSGGTAPALPSEDAGSHDDDAGL